MPPRVQILLVLLLMSAFAAGCGAHKTDSEAGRTEARTTMLRTETLPLPFDTLRGDAIALGEPAPGSWRFNHDERGQSLAEYRALRRSRPPRPGRLLVVSTLGPTTATQASLIAATREYLGAFYGLDVRAGEPIDDADVPAAHRRAERGHGEQLETRYILDSILVARRPAAALVWLALSTLDLYPQKDWNFVFGQALPSAGVGVWSLARYGRPDASGDAAQVALGRTMRTASHEVGHLLGLAHCTTFHCLMNGSNSLDELDARPLELCPVCLAKACEDRGLDPVARAGAVAATLERHGLTVDAAGFRREERLLRATR